MREGHRHQDVVKEIQQVQPIVAQQLPLAQARRAHELLGEGGVIGKIVLIPND